PWVTAAYAAVPGPCPKPPGSRPVPPMTARRSVMIGKRERSDAAASSLWLPICLDVAVSSPRRRLRWRETRQSDWDGDAPRKAAAESGHQLHARERFAQLCPDRPGWQI